MNVSYKFICKFAGKLREIVIELDNFLVDSVINFFYCFSFDCFSLLNGNLYYFTNFSQQFGKAKLFTSHFFEHSLLEGLLLKKLHDFIGIVFAIDALMLSDLWVVILFYCKYKEELSIRSRKLSANYKFLKFV